MQSVPFILIYFITFVKGADIEGIIVTPQDAPANWIVDTKVRVDGGKHFGFVQPDGHFIVTNVPSGSYLIEFTNPTFLFQPVRVDINSKGKIRARRVNVLLAYDVKAVTYPLRIATVGKAMFFQPREQLRTLDLLLNPTVLLMVLPLLLVMVLPKLMDTEDPEFKEMQKMSFFSGKNTETAGVSDYLSSMSILGSNNGGTTKKNKKSPAAGASASQTPSESRKVAGAPRRRNILN